MQAITVRPGSKDSARLETIDEPPQAEGTVLVQTLAVGICGTDLEITQGNYGWAPPGRERLVLGHESLGRVLEAPADSGLAKGDLVVGIVRRPDPVPCANCAVGEWDMCRNGQYTERGIKARDGYARERYRIEPEFAVKLDPRLGPLGVLLEPVSVLAKAWEQIDRIGRRAHWAPRKAVVMGAGPVGLLGALMGRQRGLEVHVIDKVTDGPKPDLVRDLGAAYHADVAPDALRDADVVLECTGAGTLILDAMEHHARDAIVCLTGVSSGTRTVPVALATLNRNLVLENGVVFGSVNANVRHYRAGAVALSAADPRWLARLITRRVPVARWSEALERRPDDIKAVIEFAT